jgi:drug/metabolite transporter (DMT)-like permease
LIATTQVPIIAVLSSFLLPNQPLSGRSRIGAALGLGGVASLLIGQGAATDGASVWPCLAILGAAVAWALGAIFSPRLELPVHSILRAAMQKLCGGVMLSVVSLLRGEPTLFGVLTVRIPPPRTAAVSDPLAKRGVAGAPLSERKADSGLVRSG